MNKSISIDSIVMPTHITIEALQQAAMALTYNCPVAVFRHINKKLLPKFCEPILVVGAQLPGKYEICSGFRTYQIFLETDVDKVDVIDISSLKTEEIIQLSYFATLVPILTFSSPSTHAQNEIKKCLNALKMNMPHLKEAVNCFNKIASKFQNRKRSIFGKTAIDQFLKELTADDEAKNG